MYHRRAEGFWGENMLLFVGGLSGAGKSELGRYLQDHRAFIWLELDGEKDMVDELKIRDEWEEFRKGNPVLLSKRYPATLCLRLRVSRSSSLRPILIVTKSASGTCLDPRSNA
jgi:hypothetical protein